LAFALNGVIAIITALSFAELASAFPQSGGTYLFAKKVLSIRAAFNVGWVVWFASIVAAALCPRLCVFYSGIFGHFMVIASLSAAVALVFRRIRHGHGVVHHLDALPFARIRRPLGQYPKGHCLYHAHSGRILDLGQRSASGAFQVNAFFSIRIHRSYSEIGRASCRERV
jgi:hypothetical protein